MIACLSTLPCWPHYGVDDDVIVYREEPPKKVPPLPDDFYPEEEQREVTLESFERVCSFLLRSKSVKVNQTSTSRKDEPATRRVSKPTLQTPGQQEAKRAKTPEAPVSQPTTPTAKAPSEPTPSESAPPELVPEAPVEEPTADGEPTKVLNKEEDERKKGVERWKRILEEEEQERRRVAQEKERLQERMKVAREEQRRRMEAKQQAEQKQHVTTSRQRFEERKRQAQQEETRRKEAQEAAKKKSTAWQQQQEKQRQWNAQHAPRGYNAESNGASAQYGVPNQAVPPVGRTNGQQRNHAAASAQASKNRRESSMNGSSHAPTKQHARWQQPQSKTPHASASGTSSKQSHSPQRANENAKTDEQEDATVALKRSVMTTWALQYPALQTLRPVDELIVSIHQAFPPAFGVSSHDYFSTWEPIARESLKSDEVKLKRAVRKIRFFLHPDRLPKDLDEEQSFLCKMLWDVVSDAWEHFTLEREKSHAVRQS